MSETKFPFDQQRARRKISVIIPTYNGARHLNAAIDSVLSQAGIDLELIIVDDRSSDDTFVLASKYNDPRVSVHRNEHNLGPQGNWDRALSLATGTYVKLLPQDDTLAPGTLAEQAAILDNDPEERIAIVFGARDIIDDAGRKIAHRGLKRHHDGLVTAVELARLCVRKGTNILGEPGAILFRRSLATRIGTFDAAQPYVIDLDYWLRLLAHGDGWYIHRTVSTFRVSAGSWSLAIGRNQGRQYSEFVDRMRRLGLIAPKASDVALGRLTARLNNVLRLLFYKLVVR